MGAPGLNAHGQGAADSAGNQSRRDPWVRPAEGACLRDGRRQAGHRRGAQHLAGHVKGAPDGPDRPGRMADGRPDAEQPDRQVDQEDAASAEPRDQRAAEHGSCSKREAAGPGPQADRRGAFPRVRERAVEERHG